MKLIIDIPEEKYEWIKKNNPNVDINSIVGAVANGTPLPNQCDICKKYRCNGCQYFIRRGDV